MIITDNTLKSVLDLLVSVQCTQTKKMVIMDLLVELGGRLHQQSNVIGNSNTSAISGSEIRASNCAAETKMVIYELKKILMKL